MTADEARAVVRLTLYDPAELGDLRAFLSLDTTKSLPDHSGVECSSVPRGHLILSAYLDDLRENR
jgi:hypothetical protein